MQAESCKHTSREGTPRFKAIHFSLPLIPLHWPCCFELCALHASLNQGVLFPFPVISPGETLPGKRGHSFTFGSEKQGFLPCITPRRPRGVHGSASFSSQLPVTHERVERRVERRRSLLTVGEGNGEYTGTLSPRSSGKHRWQTNKQTSLFGAM